MLYKNFFFSLFFFFAGCVTTYYCSLIGLAIYYLIASCYPSLPWTKCNEDILSGADSVCIPTGQNRSEYVTCYGSDVTQLNSTVCVKASVPLSNVSFETTNVSVISSAEQYFRFEVLKEKTDISDGLGLPDPALAGCLAVCWFMIYFSLRGGVSSSGKVAYFTAIFPYVVMLTMLVRGLTLPGAITGLKYFFTPQWEKLASLKVWYAAVTQSFFSLGIGFGVLQTYASYNRFRQNTSKDALIISFADTGTSLLAGTIIFSILGHLAHELGIPIESVVKSGAGLAFVSYPEVLAKFSFAPQLFAVLFFLMLITLGMGSAIGMFSAVTTTLCDSFPDVDRTRIVKIACVGGLAIGLFYVTPGGQIMLELVDYYGGTVLILVLASIEILAVNWIYGNGVITRDLNFMLNTKLSVYWRFCWGVICPILLPLLFFYVLFTQSGVPDLPVVGTAIGWAIATFGVLIVPIHFLLSIIADEKGEFLDRVVATVKSGKLKEKFKESFQPNDSWGPTDLEERRKWKEYIEEHDVNEWLPECISSKLNKGKRKPYKIPEHFDKIEEENEDVFNTDA